MIGAEGDDGTTGISEKRSAIHPAGQAFQPELQETFVITPSAFDAQGNDITSTNEVAGWIDNITMPRFFYVCLSSFVI